jgi:hypothetical protein
MTSGTSAEALTGLGTMIAKSFVAGVTLRTLAVGVQRSLGAGGGVRYRTKSTTFSPASL